MLKRGVVIQLILNLFGVLGLLVAGLLFVGWVTMPTNPFAVALLPSAISAFMSSLLVLALSQLLRVMWKIEANTRKPSLEAKLAKLDRAA
jgi:hypothetical protein